MIVYPAIDLFEGKAVRLFKGDYAQMTVYDTDPVAVAQRFREAGATRIHLVDLEGAKSGTTPNLPVVQNIIEATGLFAEIGGGIRSAEVMERYLAIGAKRLILGTAAVKDEAFLQAAIDRFGPAVAVGVDMRNGQVAVGGWTETTALDGISFCQKLEGLGVGTFICTDIAKDGAMQGPNLALYEALAKAVKADIIASGGVSTVENIRQLRQLNLHGAIVGKAYYTGAIDLKEAIEVAK